MFQRNEKLLTKCYTSKKEKTTDKVSCLKQQNKTETLLTKCYASTIYIHNHEIQKKKRKKKEIIYLHLDLSFKYGVQKEFHHNFFKNLQTHFHVFE